jgi:hypothetical protein
MHLGEDLCGYVISAEVRKGDRARGLSVEELIGNAEGMRGLFVLALIEENFSHRAPKSRTRDDRNSAQAESFEANCDSIAQLKDLRVRQSEKTMRLTRVVSSSDCEPGEKNRTINVT